MTRKDYVLIANALGRAFKDGNASAKATLGVAMHIANALQADNPAFEGSRFMNAVNYAMRTPGWNPVSVGQKNFPLPELPGDIEQVRKALGL